MRFPDQNCDNPTASLGLSVAAVFGAVRKTQHRDTLAAALHAALFGWWATTPQSDAVGLARCQELIVHLLRQEKYIDDVRLPGIEPGSRA